MVQVNFLGPIQKASMRLDVHSLDELGAILRNDVEVSSWLASCAIAVNDKLISDKNFLLQDGDSVCLLPPVCGG